MTDKPKESPAILRYVATRHQDGRVTALAQKLGPSGAIVAVGAGEGRTLEDALADAEAKLRSRNGKELKS